MTTSVSEAYRALRRQSLLGFVLALILPFCLAALLARWSGFWAGIGFAASALGFGAFYAWQLRCPACGVNIAASRPYFSGYVLLLWLPTRETCAKCGTSFRCGKA